MFGKNHKHSHIDPATGRNKRDNTRRFEDDSYDAGQKPRRRNGRIADRAESARQLGVGRALRRRAR